MARTAHTVSAPKKRLGRRPIEQTRALMLNAAMRLLERSVDDDSDDGLSFVVSNIRVTDVVAEATRLDERIRAADLVITGEGAFDFSSRSGKVPYGIAQHASDGIRPCIALAGQVLVGSREMRALGMESAYSMADLVGTERSYGDPAGALAELAERVARTWSR